MRRVVALARACALCTLLVVDVGPAALAVDIKGGRRRPGCSQSSRTHNASLRQGRHRPRLVSRVMIMIMIREAVGRDQFFWHYNLTADHRP